jgi:hypothetical protein
MLFDILYERRWLGFVLWVNGVFLTGSGLTRGN